MREVEMQLKENRKNELQSSKITTESTNNKKKKRKALKEIKKQIKEDAIKTLKRDIEKEKSPVRTASTKTDLFGSLNNDLNIKQMGNPAGDRETREQDVKSSILQSAIFGTTPPGNVNKSDKKAELLQRHLKQYNELMKVQPVRHTEKQLTEERIKEKNKQLQKQHKELMELRNTDQIKVDNSLPKRMDDSVEEEFARMKREHLRKQQEMERKRNEEEIKEIQLKRTKPLKSSQPQPTMKWYEKPTQPVKLVKIASLPPPVPTTNVWAERFRQQEATRLPIPSSNEEEEEMLLKVLEMSQMTAKQDEERRKYRQQMASKEFIPEQLKRQIEESKQDRTSKPETLPLKPPSKEWTSIVTSNLSSVVTKQEVKYTDPPERENKILETNYNNLQPNLKIKIPTEKPVHDDEDWTEEIQELDISPKIPNTIEKYVKWSKNAKEQTKNNTDNSISRKSCSPKPRSPVISPSNASSDNCVQQKLSHRLSIEGMETTDRDQTSRNAWTKNTSNEVHQKGDEDWDLVTDDKWGIRQNSVSHKGDFDAHIIDKNQSFYDRTDVVPRQQRYKQKPMKTVSKPEYMEQQRTKLDLNENWVSGFVDDIKRASPEDWSCGSTRPEQRPEICTNISNQTWETQWNRESIMDGKQFSSRSENRSGLINNGNRASEEHWSIGSVNNKSVPSVLSENSSIRIADDIPRIPQNHMNIGATTDIQNSTQFANTKPHVFCPDSSLEKSEVKTQHLSMSKQSEFQKTNLIVQNSIEKQQTCIENWDGEVIKEKVHSSLQEKKNIVRSVSFEKQEPVSIPSCDVKAVIKQRTIMSDCTGKTIKQGTSGESWEEDLTVVTPSNAKMMQNVELKNEQVLSDQPKTTIPGQNVNENFDHRLPVLKNLSTSSEEDVELPSCRLPRLPHIPHRQNSKIGPSAPSSVKHENHPPNHEEPTIKQPSSTSKELPTTSQQDLSGLMAGLNMSSASMNLPLGLPPHLAHAYLQFLSSGNANPTGMMPLANMPLLPGLLPMLQNPLMSASPILAYSLQQQQMAAMNIAMATGGMMGMNVPQVDATTLLRQNIPNGDGQSNRSCEKETIKQYQPPLPNSEVEAPVSVLVKNGDTNSNVTNIKCKNTTIPTAAVNSNQNRPLIHDPVKYIPQPVEPQRSMIGKGSNKSEIPKYIPQPVEPQRTMMGTGSNQSEIPKYIPQPEEHRRCISMLRKGSNQSEIPKYTPQPVEPHKSMIGKGSNQSEISKYIPQPVEPQRTMMGTGRSQAEITKYIPQPVECQKSMRGKESNQFEAPSYSKTPYDLQRKKDQVQAVQDMLSGLRKQPSSLLENSELDPRPF